MTQVTAKTTSSGHQQKVMLRFWLRILKLQRHLEAHIRERLRTHFDTTLPRFDVMAALDHHASGLRMSELSSFLKVSNGNVTGIIDRLVEDGSVVRVPVEGDRRAMLVRLTKRGKDDFNRMATAHAQWVSTYLADLSVEDAQMMIASLDRLHVRSVARKSQ